MYEAVSLGAKPITNLELHQFEHFQEDLNSFFFGVEQWTKANIVCYIEATSNTKPNPHFVFEEYWMEYVRRRVGIPFQWWDNKKQKVASLKDIALTIT